MTEIDWAPVMRLQAQVQAATNQAARDLLEAALSREVHAIARGLPRLGSTPTAMANDRRRRRKRLEIETLLVPLAPVLADPWPGVEEIIATEQLMGRLDRA